MVRKEPRMSGGIKSINKSFEVIELLKDRDGARLTELATCLDWPKSTVHSHLETLREIEYVVKEDEEYFLGMRFVELGEYAKHRKDIYSLIEPKIEKLAEDTGERVQFVVSEHGHGVYVRIAEGEHAVSTGSRLGRRRATLHATAAGKTLLAYMPEAEVYAITEQKGLPQWTENTLTDERELCEQLERIREQGFALNCEEHIEGLNAVAAPVQESDEELAGAISVAGPAHRVRGDWFTEELPNMILGVCNEVELDIAYN